MYLDCYGLSKNPFLMAPDPELLYLTGQHREALAGLIYAILNRKGFALLTGEVGTGKTTLLARTLQTIGSQQIRTSMVFHPTLTPNEFLEALMLDFGITAIHASKAQRLVQLHQFLVGAHLKGWTCTLIVDEAHKLSPELLEEIRLLGNFCQGSDRLLQILLVGQTELDTLLAREDLRQLKQRIAVRLAIKPLDRSETEDYVAFRWLRAGGRRPLPFTSEALNQIGEISRGIPRTINALCDNALMLAFAERDTTVDHQRVATAALDLRLVDIVLVPPVAPNGNGSSNGKPHAEATAAPAPKPEVERRAERMQPVPAAGPLLPGPIRVPQVGATNGHNSSFLTRWTRKLTGTD